MAHLIVRHKVKSVAGWRPVFDGFIAKRKAGGEKSAQVYHVTGDANDLVLLFEWDSTANAKKFIESPDLRAAMEKAGVLGTPEFIFLDRAW